MSLLSMLESLNVQDDEATANVMAEALNADQRIRAIMRQEIAFDVASLRRVAAALAAHNVGLESSVGAVARPKISSPVPVAIISDETS